MKKYTIKEIAKLANVSRGTVDRVIHKRGNVAESARKRVEEVLQQIDYRPNILARSLRETKTNRVVTVFPDPKEDLFWEASLSGVERGVSEFADFGIEVEKHFYHPNRPDHFIEVTDKLLETEPSGVLIAPLFHDEALDFFKKCEKLNIPSITFNTDNIQAHGDCYIGQDLVQSGRLAAHLMDLSASNEGQVLIVHVNERVENASHLLQKEEGFRQYWEQKRPGQEVITVNIGKDNSDALINYLNKEGEAISGIFISTSRSYTLSEALQKLDKVVVVGYDLLAQNTALLQQGFIDFLIDQKPEEQTYLGLSFFTDLLVFQKNIPEDKILSLGIVTRENC